MTFFWQWKRIAIDAQALASARLKKNEQFAADKFDVEEKLSKVTDENAKLKSQIFKMSQR